MKTERVLPLDDIGWTQKKKKRPNKGFMDGKLKNHMRRLSDKQVIQVRGLALRHGWAAHDLADIFGLSTGSIHAVVDGRTYAHVRDQFHERERHPNGWHRTDLTKK